MGCCQSHPPGDGRRLYDNGAKGCERPAVAATAGVAPAAIADVDGRPSLASRPTNNNPLQQVPLQRDSDGIGASDKDALGDSESLRNGHDALPLAALPHTAAAPAAADHIVPRQSVTPPRPAPDRPSSRTPRGSRSANNLTTPMTLTFVADPAAHLDAGELQSRGGTPSPSSLSPSLVKQATAHPAASATGTPVMTSANRRTPRGGGASASSAAGGLALLAAASSFLDRVEPAHHSRTSALPEPRSPLALPPPALAGESHAPDGQPAAPVVAAGDGGGQPHSGSCDGMPPRSPGGGKAAQPPHKVLPQHRTNFPAPRLAGSSSSSMPGRGRGGNSGNNHSHERTVNSSFGSWGSLPRYGSSTSVEL